MGAHLRDYLIACGVQSGKVKPEDVEDWRRLYAKDPLAVTERLAPTPRLRATFVPVAPAASEEYPASWVGAAPGTGSVAFDR
ncbi:hypothetical protein [Baekduia sp. Peel2402]|uniref:hypothetical protein n=1 Tax=Baekduia sp. Peel2402 TaxID=3458296 RepID=UPI00403EC699